MFNLNKFVCRLFEDTIICNRLPDIKETEPINGNIHVSLKSSLICGHFLTSIFQVKIFCEPYFLNICKFILIQEL